MRSSSFALIRYLMGSRAHPAKGAEALVDSVMTAPSGVNLPVSQQFLMDNAIQSKKSTPMVIDGSQKPLTDKHNHMVLRIGGAKILSPSNHDYLPNSDRANPVYYSKTSLREAGLCASLTAQLRRLRIFKLTELQGALIPLLIKGQHVIAHAETGTGKSFGIALAVANRIQRDSIAYRLHTIIFTPTEELALQYDRWLKHFGGCASQICQPAVPSIPLSIQLAKLHNIQPHVLVGTPQRIADIAVASPHLFGEKLRKKVDTLILDEADLILDEEVAYKDALIKGSDLVDRLYRCNSSEVPAQIVAASATIDGATAQRINAWMRNDSTVRISTSFVEHTIPQSITFYFFTGNHRCIDSGERRTIENEQLLVKMLSLIYKHHISPKILIFTSYSVDDVCEAVEYHKDAILSKARAKKRFAKFQGEDPNPFIGTLSTKSASPEASDRPIRHSQIVAKNRSIYAKDDENISKLCDGRLAIGVGSYGVSRGLHVTGVTHVIILGTIPPASEFVHCAGRTGRMNAEGEVITIFPPSSGRSIQDVCQSLEIPFKLTKESAVDSLLMMEDFFDVPKNAHPSGGEETDSGSAGEVSVGSDATAERQIAERRAFESIYEQQQDDQTLTMDHRLRASHLDQMLFP